MWVLKQIDLRTAKEDRSANPLQPTRVADDEICSTGQSVSPPITHRVAAYLRGDAEADRISGRMWSHESRCGATALETRRQAGRSTRDCPEFS